MITHLTLPKMICNGTIFQRDQAIRIWGYAPSRETITIDFHGKSYTTFADVNDKWEIHLDSEPAGGPYEMTISTSNSGFITLSNILVGDIFLCVGQSIMAKTFASSETLPDSQVYENENLRYFHVGPTKATTEQADFSKGEWISCDSRHISSISMLSFYFASQLYEKYQIPIGIINASVPGAPCAAFSNERVMKDFAFYQENRFDDHDIKPSTLYNGMIYPVFPFAIRGILYSQEEHFFDIPEEAAHYRHLFQTMIKSWRKQFGLGDIPFLYTQIPSTDVESSVPEYDSVLPAIRLAQESVLSLPNTAMAITYDIKNADILCETLANRLFTLARRYVYGEEFTAAGPSFRSIQKEKDSYIISFDHIGKGICTSDNKAPAHLFYKMDHDSFAPAKAVITDNKLIVMKNDDTATAKALVYAFANNPATANLSSKEGLPVAPFWIDLEDI